ncbi:MAG TPA: hypothetical protein PLQ12_01275, partial [Candidatus Defluviicoccus seviourii]|nr:hypothetical protein [Candidatus Defluviicoccus seviourii]
MQRGSSSHGADAGQEPCSCRTAGSGQILAAIADLKQMLSGVVVAPGAASGSSAPADGAESAAMRDEVAALRR